MDKTLIFFIIGLGVGLFVGNLEMPADLAEIESDAGKIVVAATEVWLIIHYVVALTTLPILAISYLKKRTNPPFRGLPLAFNAGFLCSSISMGLVGVLTNIVTT